MASLYRKYRSRSFDDVVGQDHVVRTLRNAVRSGRVAHAYLFTGPRGTGKTSTARILAKAVNCLTPRDGNPCNECENCLAANEGRAIDVIEIDAASNTSVDNVRELRERVAYASGSGAFKVYIVDEVHRLSAAAFDAFLKTLEEPPPHVIFVFASTEPHKVPETITSRCQRFDFRRIPPQETYDRLQFVAKAEGVRVTDDALRLVGQFARGSLRDALGLLDQVTAYTPDVIEANDVRAALGLADPTLVARLSDCLVSGACGSGLEEFHRFASQGGDPAQLMAQIVEYWRALLLLASGASAVAVELDPALVNPAAEHARALRSDRVVEVLRALTAQEYSSKFNIPPELSFEVRYVEAGLKLQRPLNEPASVPPQPAAAPPATSTAVNNQAPSRTPPQTKASVADMPPSPAPGLSDVPARPTTTQPSAQNGSASPGTSFAAIDSAWDAVMQQLRERNRSAQAVLKSGFLLKAENGELTIGFLHDFHANYFADVPKRKVLEAVVAEALGVSYRVRCIKTTREDVERIRGTGAVPEDDGFIQEAEERLRAFHARQLGKGHS